MRGWQLFKSCDVSELFCRELALCAVRDDEGVVVLCEAESREDYVAAAYLAGSRLARETVVLTVSGGSSGPFASTRTGAGFGLKSLTADSLAVGILQAADMVIDLTVEGFFHNPILGDVLAAGTRVLYVSDPPEVLERNLTTITDKAAALAAKAALAGGTTMHVTSSAGTDLIVDLDSANPGFQCGFADDAGRWDHWPSAMVTCWPKSSSGVVVLQPGDAILPFKTYVRDNVILRIEEGYISEIEGGSDAKFLSRFFDDANDDEARWLSHLGWGLLGSADWSSMALYDKETFVGQDMRSFRGNFLLSTGPHPFFERTTPYHLDIPLRGCDIRIDELLVVESGHLVTELPELTEDIGDDEG